MSSQSFQRNMVFSDFMIADHEALHALDDLEDLFDWASFEKPLKRLYPSQTGRPSHPLLMLFRMLLLQHYASVQRGGELVSQVIHDYDREKGAQHNFSRLYDRN